MEEKRHPMSRAGKPAVRIAEKGLVADLGPGITKTTWYGFKFPYLVQKYKCSFHFSLLQMDRNGRH